MSIDRAGTEPVTGSAPARRRPSIPWERLPVPLTTLFLIGFSLVLFGQLVEMTSALRDDFLARNVAVGQFRMVLLISLFFGLVVPALGTGLALTVKRSAAVPVLEKVADLLAPLVLMGLLPALFNVKLAHHDQLTYLLILAAFVLMAEPLLRRSFTAFDHLREPLLVGAVERRLRTVPGLPPRVLGLAAVLVAAAGVATYFGYYTIQDHHRLVTTAFDLGIYDNLLFNAIHGHPFTATVLFGPAGGNNLASHAEFVVILFIPFYAIHPGPETLLIIQALLVAFAAVPLYLFAATCLPPALAALIAIAYLFFPPLHGPVFYDFHWLTLATFFDFWLFYAIAARRKWLTVALIVVLYSIREDIAVDLAVLGLFLLLTRLRPRLGLVLFVVSAIWFGIDRFVIMPLAGSWYFQNLYSGLFADGESTFGSVFKTILSNPLFFVTSFVNETKLLYVLHMLVPLAFLPFRRLPFALLILPGVFFTVMTTGYSPTVSISFQYTTHWIAYLFLATTLAFVVISRQQDGVPARRAALVTMLVAMLAHSFTFGAILQRATFVGGFGRIEFTMTEPERQRYAELKELLAMIPPDASVAATENETPHISTRRVAYPLRSAPGPVDYLLVGRSHVGDLSRAALNAALADPNAYGLLAQRGDELFLFKRGHLSPETARARRELGVP